MAYITRSEIVPGRITERVLAKLLDDTEDGQEQEGLLDSIITAASQDVDAYLSRYSPPLANPTAFIRAATAIFALYSVYRRKGMQTAPKNPFADDRDMYIKWLEKIRDGDLALGDVALPGGSGAVVTEPMSTHTQGGGMLY